MRPWPGKLTNIWIPCFDRQTLFSSPSAAFFSIAGCPRMKCKQAKDKHCRVNKQSPESQHECQHYLGQNVRPTKYWVSQHYLGQILSGKTWVANIDWKILSVNTIWEKHTSDQILSQSTLFGAHIEWKNLSGKCWLENIWEKHASNQILSQSTLFASLRRYILLSIWCKFTFDTLSNFIFKVWKKVFKSKEPLEEISSLWSKEGNSTS